MNEPVEQLPLDDIPVPDVSQLITEDDTPVDAFSGMQMRLLTEPLYSSWEGPPDGGPFLVSANVGVFATATNNPLVPSVFLSLDTAWRHPLSEKRNRSYFIWEHGKPPDVVIEIVSNTEGSELDRKMRAYERMRVVHYVVFDPFEMLGTALLTRFAMLQGTMVLQKGDLWVPSAGLGLTLWKGTYEGEPAQWLRWCREDGSLVPSGADQRERADAATQRADAAKKRADTAAQRADAEKQQAERLRAKLRELGVDPDA